MQVETSQSGAHGFMETVVLEFPLGVPAEMPTTKERFEALENRVTRVESGLGSGPNGASKSNWIAWLPLGASVVGLLAIMVTGGIHLDNKIGTVQKDIQTMSGRMKGIEDAVKVLGNQQSDQTQKLINSLLAAAKLAKKPEIAARAIATAASLTATLKEEKRAASPEFFKIATEELTALHLSGVKETKLGAFRTQRELAEYQSALQLGQTMGTVWNCALGFNSKSMFGAGGDQTSANRFIANVTVTNCPQILDGFSWKNVVFINSRIIYHGGPVILDNVTFVNCKFEAEAGNDGFQLLQYAALDQKILKIRPEQIPG